MARAPAGGFKCNGLFSTVDFGMAPDATENGDILKGRAESCHLTVPKTDIGVICWSLRLKALRRRATSSVSTILTTSQF